MKTLKGKAHVFGDDINTDYIINSKYKAKTLDIREMRQYLMEDIDPGFYRKIRAGDFIVAGNNFGSGSSREAAPRVIQAAGIQAVLAKSFARIFYRNSINIGLPLVVCPSEHIESGDLIVVDLDKGTVINETTGNSIPVSPIPAFMIGILEMGGLESYLKIHKRFKV